MAIRPNIRYVLLGLIRMHPSISGYQLSSIINESTSFFTTIHLSQIYPALKEMTQAGWVTFETQHREGRPDLKLYRITDAGISAFEAWLFEPFVFEQTRSSYEAYSAKLIFMGFASTEQVIAYLDAGIDYFSSQIQNFEERGIDPEKAYVDLLDEPEKARFLTLWKNEFDATVDSLRGRVDNLQSLKKSIKKLEK